MVPTLGVFGLSMEPEAYLSGARFEEGSPSLGEMWTSFLGPCVREGEAWSVLGQLVSKEGSWPLVVGIFVGVRGPLLVEGLKPGPHLLCLP